MEFACVDVRDAVRHAYLRRALGMACFLTRETANVDVALLVRTLQLQATHPQGVLRELDAALPILASIETSDDFFDVNVLAELGNLLPPAVLADLQTCVTVVRAARAVDPELVEERPLDLVLVDLDAHDAQQPTFAARLRGEATARDAGPPYELPEHAAVVAHVDVHLATPLDPKSPSLLQRELMRTIELVQSA